MSAVRAGEMIKVEDPDLHDWLYQRRMTVVYALGRLPQHAILPVARQLREKGITSAAEAVRLIRVINGSIRAEMREAESAPNEIPTP
jgi:hypothetical protein